jgi:hypothetical protein
MNKCFKRVNDRHFLESCSPQLCNDTKMSFQLKSFFFHCRIYSLWFEVGMEKEERMPPRSNELNLRRRVVVARHAALTCPTLVQRGSCRLGEEPIQPKSAVAS